MSRHVDYVMKSGYLTSSERQAIDFERVLEANEELMGEGAAMAVTCEQFGVELEDHAYILIEIPEGEWWTVAHLPVNEKKKRARK